MASEALDLEGSCSSRGKLGCIAQLGTQLGLMPSLGLSSASCPARGLVRPHAQLGAWFGLVPSSGLSSASCPARGLVRPCAIIIVINIVWFGSSQMTCLLFPTFAPLAFELGLL